MSVQLTLQDVNPLIVFANELARGNTIVGKLNLIFKVQFTITMMNKNVPSLVSDPITLEQYDLSLKKIDPQLWIYFDYCGLVIINLRDISKLYAIETVDMTIDILSPIDVLRVRNGFLKYTPGRCFQINTQLECLTFESFVPNVPFIENFLVPFKDVNKLAVWLEDLFPLAFPEDLGIYVRIEEFIQEKFGVGTRLLHGNLEVVSTPQFCRFLNQKQIIPLEERSKLIIGSSDMELLYKELWRIQSKIQNYHHDSIERSSNLPAVLIEIIVEYTVFGSEGSFRPIEPKKSTLPIMPPLPAHLQQKPSGFPVMPPFPTNLRRINQ